MTRAFDRRLWNRRPAPAEKPLRDELLSIEGLEERALALAASFTIDPNPRRRARNIFPRFEDNVRFLRAAYRTLADDVRTGQFVASAAEWLLDNFHLVSAEITDIRQNLPRTYYRELPTLASREQAGHARIYAIAVELVRHSDSRLERQQLTQFLNSYQRVAPLTIGELWAWPSMLKLALIENLRRLAEEMLMARAERGAADIYISRMEEGTERAALALPALPDAAFVVQLLHRVREYGLRLVADPHRRRRAPRVAADHRRGCDSRRAPAPGRRPGVGGERHHEPSPVRDARLAAVRRVGEPRRAGPAARSGGRVRTDGLPEPRSAAAGGRRRWPRRAATRRCASRCGRSRAPARRRRRIDRAIVRPTSAITSSIEDDAISKRTSPIGPAFSSEPRARRRSRHASAVYLGRDCGRDRDSASRRRSHTLATGGGSPAVQVVVALLLLIPASDVRDRCAFSGPRVA